MEESISLTPSALVNLFSNAIQFDEGKQMQRIKGIYILGKGVVYGGQYYDGLKDELTDASVTLIVPGAIRNNLNSNEVIEVEGYVIKRVQPIGARIELQFFVTAIVSQDAATITEEDQRVFAVLQEKAKQGYRDVDGFIKGRILKDEPVSIKILIGKSAIIDSDITNQLKDAVAFYAIEFIRINLANEKEIIDALQNTDADVLAISRGGGEKMEVFDSPVIASVALFLTPNFVTALGHSQDTPLLQKVADKAFITPTAFGQHLNDLYNNTIAERSQSKAGMIEAVTKQLKPLYEKQIENLKMEFGNKELQYKNQLQLLEEKFDIIQSLQLSKQRTNWIRIILLVLSAIAAGILIGHFIL